MNTKTTTLLKPSHFIGKIQLTRIRNKTIFRFTDDLQLKMEELLEKRKADLLSSEEVTELESIGELDRILTHINAMKISNSCETGIELDSQKSLADSFAELREICREENYVLELPERVNR
jgi:hypothetical protein